MNDPQPPEKKPESIPVTVESPVATEREMIALGRDALTQFVSVHQQQLATAERISDKWLALCSRPPAFIWFCAAGVLVLLGMALWFKMPEFPIVLTTAAATWFASRQKKA